MLARGEGGLGSDGLSAAASCLDSYSRLLDRVSGPAGLRPLLYPVFCHLPPLHKGHPHVLQGLLQEQGHLLGRGVSDLPGDDQGYRV